jgi:hypothetical protein
MSVQSPFPVEGTIVIKESGYRARFPCATEWLSQTEHGDLLQWAVDRSRAKYGTGVEVRVRFTEDEAHGGAGDFELLGVTDSDASTDVAPVAGDETDERCVLCGDALTNDLDRDTGVCTACAGSWGETVATGRGALLSQALGEIDTVAADAGTLQERVPDPDPDADWDREAVAALADDLRRVRQALGEIQGRATTAHSALTDVYEYDNDE